MNEESRAEKARSKDDGEVRLASGDKVPANNSTVKEVSASKLKLRALGKQVKVGKDVGGHVIAAMTKLHAFISDHSNNGKPRSSWQRRASERTWPMPRAR